MEIKSLDPKLKQSETAKELGRSSSTLKRHRNDINMLSSYRMPPSNTHTRKQNTSNHPEHDLKMGSKDLKLSSNGPVKYKKNKIKKEYAER